MDFVAILKEFGLPIALVIYYAWKDFLTSRESVTREDRLAARLNLVEDAQRNEMRQLTGDTVKAIQANTTALEEFVSAVQTRPCLLNPEQTARLKHELRQEMRRHD